MERGRADVQAGAQPLSSAPRVVVHGLEISFFTSEGSSLPE
jgi:hypothetical protein